MPSHPDRWRPRALSLGAASVAALLLAAAASAGATASTAPNAGSSAAAASAAAAAAADATAPELTLDQLTRTVLEHNPDLQAALQSRTTAQAGVTTAAALLNPRIEWTQGRNAARLPSATNDGRAQGIGVSQFIENPALREGRIDAARALERGSQHAVAFTRNDLAAQVRLLGYQAVLRRSEARAAADAVTLLEQARERVRVRVESGEAARYELIKADAEIVNARLRQQSAALMAEQALLELNRLAAGRLPARWSIAASLDDAQGSASLDEIQQHAQRNNPELSALQAQVERAQAQLQAARASRWPGVELRYQQNRDPEVRQNMLGVSVQVPLLDKRTGPIGEAASELERARSRLEGRHAELQQQVLLAWKSLEMARLRVESLSTGAVRQAEAAVRVAEAAYRFGERGILDVLDAQRVLRGVRADLLDARYQVQAARIALDRLAGRYAQPPQP